MTPAPLIPVSRVQTLHHEAIAAARTYPDLRSACPYPWHTLDARLFRLFFTSARDLLGASPLTTTQAQP